MDFSHRITKRLWPKGGQQVTIDVSLLAAMETALVDFQFKLCEPPTRDVMIATRPGVWDALCKNRDKRLLVVRQCLTDLHSMKLPRNKVADKAFS